MYSSCQLSGLFMQGTCKPWSGNVYTHMQTYKITLFLVTTLDDANPADYEPTYCCTGSVLQAKRMTLTQTM